MQIQITPDRHNPLKEHIFLTLEDGGVWYNQGINGTFFYNYFVPALDTGYADLYEGQLSRPHYYAPAFITSEADGNHSQTSEFRSYHNQKVRIMYVEKINKTRARVEYELPRSGWVKAWFPCAKYGGTAVVERRLKPGKSPTNKMGVCYA